MLVVISLETMIERTKGLSIDYSALLTHSPSREQNFPLFCGQPSSEGEGKTNKKKSVVCGCTVSRLFSFCVVFCIGGALGVVCHWIII